jgi:hypothetical protein
MFGGLIFGLSLRRQLTQMFHHGVWIDLADGADLVFVLVFLFSLVLVLAFAEQATGDVAKSAEPALSFKDSLVLHLVFEFALVLFLELFFPLGFKFRQSFQFTFILVCHDDESSCTTVRLVWARCD